MLNFWFFFFSFWVLLASLSRFAVRVQFWVLFFFFRSFFSLTFWLSTLDFEIDFRFLLWILGLALIFIVNRDFNFCSEFWLDFDICLLIFTLILQNDSGFYFDFWTFWLISLIWLWFFNHSQPFTYDFWLFTFDFWLSTLTFGFLTVDFRFWLMASNFRRWFFYCWKKENCTYWFLLWSGTQWCAPPEARERATLSSPCLLYTSDAADE